MNSMVQQGFAEAQRITKQNARTFYLTSFFLPAKIRQAAYSIYAVCRLSDESVDDLRLNLDAKEQALTRIREKVDLAFSAHPVDDPLLKAFRATLEEFKIPQKCFHELLDGMAMDLTKKRYKDFHDLHVYCYRVAGVIGLIMLRIFDCHDLDAEKYAIDLGVALQLTNILRDIKEDFSRERIYLPEDEMKRFGITEDYVRGQIVDQDFQDFMVFQIKRARDHFFRASQGLELIKNGRCRFVAFLIAEMYAQILNEIEKNHYDVYTKRAFIPKSARIASLFFLWIRFIRNAVTFRL